MSEAPSIDAYLATLEGSAPDSPPGEVEVAADVRKYLAAVRTHLRERHVSGASGQEVNEAHSDLIDRLVRRLFDWAEEAFLAAGGEVETDLTVLAVGGYARREMSICSDVDLLFLYRGKLTPHVASIAERVQYCLWDAALAVGGATRTIADTIGLALKDPMVRTEVLEPRFLAGSGILFHEFVDTMRGRLLAEPSQFIAEQIEALRERHTRFGDSLYLLQPNVKDGAGGLRDYHVSYWVMQATQATARGRDDFLHLGLLTEDEVREYLAAVDFLWRVRNELHLRAGRKNDQMSFELQERVADSFGYAETTENDVNLPVERFMRDYYRCARSVRNCSSLVIEQCNERVCRRPRSRQVEEVEGGFRIADGRLQIPRARLLREEPLKLLLAFAVAQRHDVPLTQKAQRLIRENLDLIDETFRRSPQARELFLGILDADHRVTRSLVAMNEVGLLARFLPEWERTVCRWQHVLYHTYTVDVHAIFLVEELRRLLREKHEQAFPGLAELMRNVDDRPVLYLGCLLHDIGKGLSGDHASLGADLARACLERLGLSGDRLERVVFLVQYHLLMSRLAQRRDFSHPRLLLDFALTVGDRTNLRNLYLLTFADIRASSSAGWTAWKQQLLSDLYERTAEFLEMGADDPDKAIEVVERRIEALREGAAAELRALGVSHADVEDYFGMMPRRYFRVHTAEEIARHAQVVFGLAPDRVMSTAVRETSDGLSEFILCTRDVHGLYANVAGALTAHGINIFGANVYTTRSGLALEAYRVATPRGGEEEHRIVWQEFERSLEAVLSGEIQVEQLLRGRRRPIGAAVIPQPKPATVEISNQESDFYTIVDVAANDRPGLLHDLTRTLSEHGCEIYISKAATLRDQVADTFYLRDRDGRKLHDPEEIERLRQALLGAARLGEDGDGG